MKDSFIDTLSTHLRAGTSIMAVNTDEESRCIEEIRRAAWKSCNGLRIQVDSHQYQDLQAIFTKFLDPGDGDPNLLLDPTEETVRYDYTIFTSLVRKIGEEIQKNSDTTFPAMQDLIIDLLNRGCHIITWDHVGGFSPTNVGHNLDTASDANALDDALAATIIRERFPENCVFVFKDCHHHLNDGDQIIYRRILRNLFESNALINLAPGKEFRRHIIFVQPEWSIHRDVQGCVTMLEFDLPNEEHLDKEISIAEASVDDKTKTCPSELRPQICLALRGFTQMEAASALGYCLAKHRGFDPEMIRTIHRLQRAVFAKNAVLNLIDDDDIASTDQIGGFENAIEFAEECKICWTPEARKVGLRRPKGCLLLGIPGTGKTLFGKVLARIMDLPLIIYDVSAQFGSLVGQTETTTKMALAQIKAKGPCVVLIDEADKLFSGVVGGYNGDSGVAQRMLSRLLTFMSTENEEAFVVLTMNRTIGIPPEMLRAGRLDALFYTTFPTTRESIEILGIHLKKNGADLSAIDHKAIAAIADPTTTNKYVGAELEQIVIKAVRSAFKNRGELTPTAAELIEAKKTITPVVCLDKVSIEHMDNFCKDIAKPVSKPEAISKVWSVKSANRQIRTNPLSN